MLFIAVEQLTSTILLQLYSFAYSQSNMVWFYWIIPFPFYELMVDFPSAIYMHDHTRAHLYSKTISTFCMSICMACIFVGAKIYEICFIATLGHNLFISA